MLHCRYFDLVIFVFASIMDSARRPWRFQRRVSPSNDKVHSKWTSFRRRPTSLPDWCMQARDLPRKKRHRRRALRRVQMRRTTNAQRDTMKCSRSNVTEAQEDVSAKDGPIHYVWKFMSTVPVVFDKRDNPCRRTCNRRPAEERQKVQKKSYGKKILFGISSSSSHVSVVSQVRVPTGIF